MHTLMSLKWEESIWIQLKKCDVPLNSQVQKNKYRKQTGFGKNIPTRELDV